MNVSILRALSFDFSSFQLLHFILLLLVFHLPRIDLKGLKFVEVLIHIAKKPAGL